MALLFTGFNRNDLALWSYFNPLLPNVTICSRIVKILFLKREGIIEKYFYERRAYESVGDNSLS